MRITGIISIVAIVLYAAIALLQLWFESFSADTFGKITITFAIVIGALVVSTLIRREYVQDGKLRKDGYID